MCLRQTCISSYDCPVSPWSSPGAPQQCLAHFPRSVGSQGPSSAWPPRHGVRGGRPKEQPHCYLHQNRNKLKLANPEGLGWWGHASQQIGLRIQWTPSTLCSPRRRPQQPCHLSSIADQAREPCFPGTEAQGLFCSVLMKGHVGPR